MAFTKQDITRLRKTTDDQSIMDTMLQQDSGFKQKVDRVKTANPNMDALEEANFPRAMIDIHLGIDNGSPLVPETTQMASSATEPKKTGFAGETIRNIPKSGAALAGSIFDAIASPFETMGALADTAIGGAANTVETIAGALGAENAEQIFDLPSEQVASAVGDFFAERYGGVENIKNTIKEDPVGFAADLTAILSIVGGGLRAGGRAAQVGAVTRAGQVATKAAQVIDPIATAGRVASTPLKFLAKPIKALNNANIKSAFNLTPSQVQRITRMGKSPAQFLAENKVVGNTSDDIIRSLETIHSDSFKQLRTVLDPIKDTFNVTQVEDLDRILAQLVDDFDQPGLRKLRESAKTLAGKEELTLSEFTEAISLIDKADFIFKKSGDVGAGFRAKGASKVRAKAKEFVEVEADARGVPNVREIKRTTQISKGLLDEIGKSGDKGARFLSIRDAVYGGAAGIVVGPVGGFLTILGERIAAFPAVATRLNLALSSLSATEFKALQIAIKTGEITGDSRRVFQSIIQSIESSPLQPETE
jgi:hypothetical protein